MSLRNTTKLRIAVVAVAALPLVAAGCGSDDDSASGSDSGSQSVAAVIKGLDNPFFQTMEDGIDAQADEAGVDVTVQAAQSITDTTGQAERLSALSQQDFGCYIVNPITGNNLVQGLAQVGAKDVPIVNIDQPIDADAAEAAGVDPATYVGTDNVQAGGLAGEHMAEVVGSGTVGIIGGLAGDVTSNDRVTGFTDAVEGTLDTLPVVAADWDRQKALTTATDLMTANPDIKGFFAANDDMGLGIARAVANAGKTGQVAVISVDGNEDAIKAVQAGDLEATVAQYPYAVGQLGVQACQAAMAGEDLPDTVTSPVALVTEDKAAGALEKFPEPFESFDNPLDALTD
ncbi:ribose transport system substrate-binding protein/D-allose transport system substrate-binding protein [Mumia flava]|uniref:Ribose transport system substrate-binding protein/D-allose transport system substrate-binding protein n=1 Tax=Mumia flava TaxID=1348852 RepID=A0A0B2BAN4_9ACTN|nr:substrate-binding domain-containing protein [Mumia flava]PJJ53798.1 ribose transport system substrate-binding protein/D-allose transport system substrate-binding protein [Mumia flava]